MRSVIRFGAIFLAWYAFISFNLFGQAVQDNSPFDVSVSYTGDVFGNTVGGADQGLRYFDNIDVNMEVNFGELPLGLDGTTFYIYGIGNQGGSITELVQDLQGTSNIEAENSWRIFEAWAQQKFFLANSSILAGLYDINSEFNVLNSSLLFLNSSHGLDPTIALSGKLGPSTFPYTSLAARFKINPYRGLVLQGALLDGVPSNPENTRGTKVFFREEDGIFMIGEINYHGDSGRNLQIRNRVARLESILAPGVETDNKFAVGGWYYSKQRAVYGNSANTENEYGVYAMAEYEILKDAGNKSRSTSVFTRLGWSNPDVRQVTGFVGGGIVMEGLLAARPNDKTGIAVAHTSLSSDYIDYTKNQDGVPIREDAETNFELTHLIFINEYTQLQANFQYILNPGAEPTLDNAFVTGMRIMIGF